MSYTAKTEEQLAKEGLMSDGEYDFEVIETSDKPSKAGNAMATLKLNVFAEDGSGNHLTDYISFGSNFGERKWRRAADACGLLAEYESGKLVASDFMSKCGKVIIKTQEGNPEYPLPKNVVAEYVKRPAGFVAANKPIPKEVEEDVIPF